MCVSWSLASVKGTSCTSECTELLKTFMCQTGVLFRLLDAPRKNKAQSKPFTQEITKYSYVHSKRISNQLNANAETHSSVYAKILAVFSLTDRQFHLGISLIYYTTYTYDVSRDSSERLPTLLSWRRPFFLGITVTKRTLSTSLHDH